jgi:preprotein translocase subunit SecA
VLLRAALAILERPCHPDPVWALPAAIYAPENDKFRQNSSELETDMQISRFEEAIHKNSLLHKVNSEPEVPQVSRNAPCPCGSGHKYKRCHGAAA